MNEKTAVKNIVLIIDDNKTNLDVLFDLLKNAGLKVLVALDGESALERLKYVQPDIILLDVMMPGIDGFETCRRLKENPTTQDIPVIFMTALSDTASKVKGFQMGAVDYITKPFQHEEVSIRIQTHLTMRQLQKKLQEKNEELTSLNQNLEKLVEQKTKLLIDREKTATIGRLTQGIVHNLKNPLQAIQSSVDLIELKAMDLPNNEMLLNYCTNIINAVGAIAKIMENLMLKTREDRYESLMYVNINELLERELEFLDANIHFKHKIEKNYFLDRQIASIPLIYSHLSQVFHNLLNNALDAMWEEPTRILTIITRQDENKIYIDIEDTGCGIEPENLTKIFDPFYTSKPAKGETTEIDFPTGTGLGLYTCLELLKPLNGEISVASKVGKGSKFTVSLPKFIND